MNQLKSRILIVLVGLCFYSFSGLCSGQRFSVSKDLLKTELELPAREGKKEYEISSLAVDGEYLFVCTERNPEIYIFHFQKGAKRPEFSFLKRVKLSFPSKLGVCKSAVCKQSCTCKGDRLLVEIEAMAIHGGRLFLCDEANNEIYSVPVLDLLNNKSKARVKSEGLSCLLKKYVDNSEHPGHKGRRGLEGMVVSKRRFDVAGSPVSKNDTFFYLLDEWQDLRGKKYAAPMNIFRKRNGCVERIGLFYLDLEYYERATELFEYQGKLYAFLSLYENDTVPTNYRIVEVVLSNKPKFGKEVANFSKLADQVRTLKKSSNFEAAGVVNGHHVIISDASNLYQTSVLITPLAVDKSKKKEPADTPQTAVFETFPGDRPIGNPNIIVRNVPFKMRALFAGEEYMMWGQSGLASIGITLSHEPDRLKVYTIRFAKHSIDFDRKDVLEIRFKFPKGKGSPAFVELDFNHARVPCPESTDEKLRPAVNWPSSDCNTVRQESCRKEETPRKAAEKTESKLCVSGSYSDAADTLLVQKDKTLAYQPNSQAKPVLSVNAGTDEVSVADFRLIQVVAQNVDVSVFLDDKKISEGSFGVSTFPLENRIAESAKSLKLSLSKSSFDGLIKENSKLDAYVSNMSILSTAKNNPKVKFGFSFSNITYSGIHNGMAVSGSVQGRLGFEFECKVEK